MFGSLKHRKDSEKELTPAELFAQLVRGIDARVDADQLCLEFLDQYLFLCRRSIDAGGPVATGSAPESKDHLERKEEGKQFRNTLKAKNVVLEKARLEPGTQAKITNFFEACNFIKTLNKLREVLKDNIEGWLDKISPSDEVQVKIGSARTIIEIFCRDLANTFSKTTAKELQPSDHKLAPVTINWVKKAPYLFRLFQVYEKHILLSLKQLENLLENSQMTDISASTSYLTEKDIRAFITKTVAERAEEVARHERRNPNKNKFFSGIVGILLIACGFIINPVVGVSLAITCALSGVGGLVGTLGHGIPKLSNKQKFSLVLLGLVLVGIVLAINLIPIVGQTLTALGLGLVSMFLTTGVGISFGFLTKSLLPTQTVLNQSDIASFVSADMKARAQEGERIQATHAPAPVVSFARALEVKLPDELESESSELQEDGPVWHWPHEVEDAPVTAVQRQLLLKPPSAAPQASPQVSTPKDASQTHSSPASSTPGNK